ncbi:hypothetical protein [Streptomyces sp. MP131-18]|uniref:hypothetical protein n=1 Tax=Streptomyces sp. MP131-18 TaxID=1857892 RepID=UPI00097BAC99|nr:hypothetical protein [Streptomyces sp. MP131-18]ONK11453.1 hypothetical protein STBA_21850 [Streptomyces sp. MP131-18]
MREPFSVARSAIVHKRDVGAVAAPGHYRQTCVLPEPVALTEPDKARVLAEALGREVHDEGLTERAAREKWAAEGRDARIVVCSVAARGDPPEAGRTVLPTVERVPGRLPLNARPGTRVPRRAQRPLNQARARASSASAWAASPASSVRPRARWSA